MRVQTSIKAGLPRPSRERLRITIEDPKLATSNLEVDDMDALALLTDPSHPLTVEGLPEGFDPDAVARHADEASRLLKALANPNRLMILCVLSQGECSVSELNGRVPLSQSALSQHLAVLRADELVATRRAAQTIYYRTAEGPALRVVRLMHDLYCAESCGIPTQTVKGKQR